MSFDCAFKTIDGAAIPGVAEWHAENGDEYDAEAARKYGDIACLYGSEWRTEFLDTLLDFCGSETRERDEDEKDAHTSPVDGFKTADGLDAYDGLGWDPYGRQITTVDARRLAFAALLAHDLENGPLKEAIDACYEETDGCWDVSRSSCDALPAVRWRLSGSESERIGRAVAKNEAYRSDFMLHDGAEEDADPWSGIASEMLDELAEEAKGGGARDSEYASEARIKALSAAGTDGAFWSREQVVALMAFCLEAQHLFESECDYAVLVPRSLVKEAKARLNEIAREALGKEARGECERFVDELVDFARYHAYSVHQLAAAKEPLAIAVGAGCDRLEVVM